MLAHAARQVESTHPLAGVRSSADIGGGGGGGGPPECIAASFEACGEDDDCLTAWMTALCAGEIDRSSCSEDDNANIDDHLSRQCGGEH